MLADHVITRDEMWAVGATFTLVAWAFAYLYVGLQAIEPGSFTAAVSPEADRTWMELLYLSFTTLTSVGLSDIVPVKPFARSRGHDRAARRRRLRRDPGLPAHRPHHPPGMRRSSLDAGSATSRSKRMMHRAIALLGRHPLTLIVWGAVAAERVDQTLWISLRISLTEALASPNSIAVFGS